MSRSEYEHILHRQSKVSAKIAEAVSKGIDWPIFNEFSLRELFCAKRIIIVGCGDSWIAGYAAKPVFERIARVEADVIRCIDFSRHLPGKELMDAPGNPMVIGISVTGNASRLIEAMERAKAYGANTVAITNKPESLAAAPCNHIIPLSLPEGMEMNPGCNTYNASMMTLIQLALRIARAKNTITYGEFEEMKKAPLNIIRKFAENFDKYDEIGFEIADRWRNLKGYEFIGDYGDYSTAYFGLAKAHELVGGYSMCTDSESWLHANRYFNDPKNIGRLVVANSTSPSFDSSVRAVKTICELGSPCLVVTDSEDNTFPEGCDVVVMPTEKYDWVNPLVQHFIFDIISGYMRTINASLDNGKIYRDYAPAYSNPKNMDGKRIWGSKIEIV